MQLDAEQIVGALLQHPNEIVRMATENVILQAQVAALTGQIPEEDYDGIGLVDTDESGTEAPAEGEDQ